MVSKGGQWQKVQSFNPKLILTQMCVLQCVWYFIFAINFSIWSMFHGRHSTISPLFRLNSYSFTTTYGIGLIGCSWFSALLMAFVLPPIVERLKNCADFVITYHFIHILLALVIFGSALPNLAFWISQIIGALISILLGEYLCLTRSIQDIILSPKEKKKNSKCCPNLV